MPAVNKNIYIDLKYGFDKLASGDFSPVLDANSINQSLLTLLYTKVGERFFNPTYGTNVWLYLFEPFTQTTASSIADEIESAITFWEGSRIKLTNINTVMDFNNLAYIITIYYQILSTSISGSLTLTLPQQGL
jgi:phage baseplate assembly protein W